MAKENKNLSTETFKLNTEIPVEKEIRELLDRSTNKSGLIKDALSMYNYVIQNKGYVSPYLQNNVGNWDILFNNLDANVNNLIGRQAEQVKQEVIQTMSQEVNNPVNTNSSDDSFAGREEISLEIFDEDDEENEDNEVDF